MEKVIFEGEVLEYSVKPNLKTEETNLTITYTVKKDNNNQVKTLTDYQDVGRANLTIFDTYGEVIELENVNVEAFSVKEKKLPKDLGFITVVKGKLTLMIEPTDRELTGNLNQYVGSDFKLELSPAK